MSLAVATVNLVIDVIKQNSECSLSALEKLLFFVFSRGKSKLVNPFPDENISNYYFTDKFLHYVICKDDVMTALDSKVFSNSMFKNEHFLFI